jgi:hypothetical protein
MDDLKSTLKVRNRLQIFLPKEALFARSVYEPFQQKYTKKVVPPEGSTTRSLYNLQVMTRCARSGQRHG